MFVYTHTQSDFVSISLTVKLYCSFVTKELLLNNPKYAFWEDHIVSTNLRYEMSLMKLLDSLIGESLHTRSHWNWTVPLTYL